VCCLYECNFIFDASVIFTVFSSGISAVDVDNKIVYTYASGIQLNSGWILGAEIERFENGGESFIFGGLVSLPFINLTCYEIAYDPVTQQVFCVATQLGENFNGTLGFVASINPLTGVKLEVPLPTGVFALFPAIGVIDTSRQIFFTPLNTWNGSESNQLAIYGISTSNLSIVSTVPIHLGDKVLRCLLDWAIDPLTSVIYALCEGGSPRHPEIILATVDPLNGTTTHIGTIYADDNTFFEVGTFSINYKKKLGYLYIQKGNPPGEIPSFIIEFDLSTAAITATYNVDEAQVFTLNYAPWMESEKKS